MSALVGRVLVVDADEGWRRRVTEWLEAAGWQAEARAPGLDALVLVDQVEPEVLVVGVRGNDDATMEFLERSRERAGHAVFVGLMAPEAMGLAAEAVRRGIDICLPAPSEPQALLVSVQRAAQRARVAGEALRLRRRAAATLSLANFEAIVGNHPLMQEMLKRVAQVAPTRASVLIHGESGTGKELIAAAIHQNSKRRTHPFVRLNCAALAESVLESELFGHERGAFTGAVARREGRFKQADGGTLLLDEVSEIPRATQVKLLRFLQDREFERVGGNETQRVDVRIVAATNRDLRSLVSDGVFREDLYYRLNVVRIEVPPLRARPSDILLLAEHFVRLVAEENGLEILGFTQQAKDAMLAYPWPGNVRELQNAVEQAVVMSEDREIGTASLPLSSTPPHADPLPVMVPGVTLAELERFAILRTLEAVGGSTARTAAILGVSRRTIQYRLQEWGLRGRDRVGCSATTDGGHVPDDD